MSWNQFCITYFQSTTGASSPTSKGCFTLKRHRTIFTFHKIFFIPTLPLLKTFYLARRFLLSGGNDIKKFPLRGGNDCISITVRVTM